jgi:predicted metal-dependent hydrolase
LAAQLEQLCEAFAQAHAMPLRVVSANARSTLRIAIKHDHVELRMPNRAQLPDILRFLAPLRPWITRAVARRHAIDQRVRSQCWLDPGATCQLMIAGEVRPLCWKSQADDYPANAIVLDVDLSRVDCVQRSAKVLLKTLYEHVEHHALAFMRELEQRHGHRARSVRVWPTISQWGSLNIHGQMSLSLALAPAPLSVLKYVVAHELAHLKHRDHSVDFWAEVARLMPSYLTERRQLRRHGETYQGIIGHLLQRANPE